MLCASYPAWAYFFDSVLLTAGQCHAVPSGSPQDDTSAGLPKSRKGPSSLGWCCNPEATLMAGSSEGWLARCQLSVNSDTDIPVYNVTIGRVKYISFSPSESEGLIIYNMNCNSHLRWQTILTKTITNKIRSFNIFKLSLLITGILQQWSKHYHSEENFAMELLKKIYIYIWKLC